MTGKREPARDGRSRVRDGLRRRGGQTEIQRAGSKPGAPQTGRAAQGRITPGPSPRGTTRRRGLARLGRGAFLALLDVDTAADAYAVARLAPRTRFAAALAALTPAPACPVQPPVPSA